MRWAAGRWRARGAGPRRGLAQRRGPAGAEPEGAGPVPFSASKASPRAWSVSQSMGSHHARPWSQVLPLSLLCAGLLLWCALREETDIDARLEAAFSGRAAGAPGTAPGSDGPLRPREEE